MRAQHPFRWEFTGTTVDRDGQARERRLFKLSRVPIRRHVQIRAAANPYDPAWERYFERRLAQTMEATLAGRRSLLHLWKRQDGRCSRCHQPITSETGWHSHHVVWRSHGGGDGAANRVLLHPTCHQQCHSPGQTNTSPRPVTRASRKA